MDPMEAMSTGGSVPANFNAEDAGNMEDVSATKKNTFCPPTGDMEE